MNPVLGLIIANIIWGAASPIFKFALLNIPPFTLAFIRFFFAGLIFLPMTIEKWQRMSMRDLFEICISAFFGVTINIIFFFLGLQRSESINAPIIASAGPVVIYILSVLFLREKARMKVMIGMLLSFIGVAVIIFSPIFLDGARLVTGEIWGNIFFVLSMIGAVVNTIMNKEVLKRINAVQVTCVGFLFGSLTFFPFMVSELRTWPIIRIDYHGWTGIIFGVFLSSALAYYLWNSAMSKIDAQEVGIFTYIDPVSAILLAIPLVHEYPNIYFFLGTLLVFGGIYISEGRVHWHPFHRLKARSARL